jgi:hypothetical protein
LAEESQAEKYLRRASQLLKAAAQDGNQEHRDFLAECAEEFMRLAAELMRSSDC